MRRMMVGFGVVTVGLVALLGQRVRAQQADLGGPAGGSGTAEAAEVTVSSRVGGRVVERLVREGEAVIAGQPLLRLDCAEPDAALAEAKARVAVAQAQAQAADAAAGAARASADAAGAAAAATKRQGAALATQQAASARQADRLDRVGQDAPVATRDQARAQAEGLGEQVAASQAQQAATGAQARAATEQAAAASSQREAARLSIEAAEAAARRAEIAFAECTVVAPRAAVVRLLPYEVGELVGPGATLVELVDLSSIWVTFYLPNAELAAAVPGGTATVQADAWPGRTFQGAIRKVATEPEFTPRNIQTRADRDRLVFAVEVLVDNPDGALRPGMPVDVRLSEDTP